MSGAARHPGAPIRAGAAFFVALSLLPLDASAAKPPFLSGERLTYQIRWLGIPMLKVRFTAEGPLAWKGRRAYRYRAKVKSLGLLKKLYPIRDVAVSHADASRLTSYRMDLYQRHGRSKGQRWFVFNGKSVTYGRSGKKTRLYQLPGEALDALSALYKLRASGLRPGGSVEVPVFGRRRRLRVLIKMTRTERIESLWGPIRVYRVEPRVVGKKSESLNKRATAWIWVTADELRVPVRMESRTILGSVVAHLIETHRLKKGPLARAPIKKLSGWRPSTKVIREERAGAYKKLNELLGKRKK